jgi:S1-C subfamily serine protease
MLLLICFGIVGACFAQDPSTRQFVYTVSVPKTAKHPALIQTGFRLAGTKGIVTSLHGVADGSSFSAFNENGDALRNLTIEMVDIARDLALLRSDELITRPADGLNSCHSSIVSGQSLHALGHPVGIDLWNKPVTAGNPPQRLLSGLIPPPLAKDFGDRRSPADDRDVIGLDGNLVPGDSGAPLLTDTNETCGVVDGGLLGGAAGISWAIPLGSVNWRQSTNAMQDIQRIAALDIANLFAFEEDTEAASGQFVVAPGEQGSINRSATLYRMLPLVELSWSEKEHIRKRAISR